MMRFALVLLPLLATPAVAQTTVRLDATGEVRRLPDEFAATLRVEARAASAAAAQAAVNRAVAAALAQSVPVRELVVATGRYAAYRSSEPRGGTEPRGAASWMAMQELTLRSADATAALAMVGTWQEQGLAVSRLGWRLTPALEAAMRDEATRLALAALEQRLALVAGQLRLVADGLAKIEIDGGEAPMLRAMAAPSAAREAAAPVAVPEEASVRVRATGEAVLRRR